MALITTVASGAGNNGAGSTSVSAATASYARQINDLAVLVIAINMTTTDEDAYTSTTVPSGWVDVGGEWEAGSGANNQLVIRVFRATSAATAVSTFTSTILSRKAAAAVRVFRGADTSATPVVLGTLASSASNTLNPTGPSSVNNQDALMLAAAIEGVRTRTSAATGFTAGSISSSSGGGSDATKETVYEDYNLSTATSSFVGDAVISASADWRAVMIRIKSAAPSQNLQRTTADTITTVTESVARAAMNKLRAVADSVSLTTTILYDTFSRTASNGWGTPDTGIAYVNIGDPTKMYPGSGVGNIVVETGTTGTDQRGVYNDIAVADAEIYAILSCDSVVNESSNNLWQYVWLRYNGNASSPTGYCIRFRRSGTAILYDVLRFNAGSQTSISLGNFTENAGFDVMSIRFGITGSQLKWKVWQYSIGQEPSSYTTATDSNISSAGFFGVTAKNATSSTEAWISTIDNITIQAGGSTDSIIAQLSQGAQQLFRTAADTITTVSESAGRIITAFRTTSESIPFISDTVAAAKIFPRIASDTVTAISDSVARVANKLRTASETLTTSDAVARVANKIRTVADSTTVTDSVIAARFFVRLVSDTITTVTDSVARIANKIRSATDTTTVSDSVSRLFVWARSAVDSVVTSDAVNRVITILRTTTDTTTVSDAVARSIKWARAAVDTLTTSDTVSRVLSALRSATDTTAVTDSITRSIKWVRSLVDTTSVTDAVARLIIFPRTVADTVTTVTDSVVRAAASKIRSAADAVTTSDAAARLVSAFKTASDAVTTTDSVVRQIFQGAQQFFRTASDSITTSDAVMRLVTMARSTADAVTTSDSVTRAFSVVRSAIDTVVTSDSIVRLSNKVRSVTDTTSVTDSVMRGGLVLVRLASDATASVSDAVIRVSNKIRSATDATGLSESVSRSWQGVRSVVDTLPAIVDTVVTGLSVILYRVASDTISIGADTVSRIGQFSRSTADAVVTSDAVSRLVSAGRFASDTIIIGLDTVVRSGVTVIRSAADAVATSDFITTLRGVPHYTGEVIKNIGGLLYWKIGKNSHRRDNVDAASNSMTVESSSEKLKVK